MARFRKEIIIQQLKNKLLKNEVKNYEIVVALIAMTKAEVIKLDDVQPMLMEIFSNNIYDLMDALIKAHDLIDEDLIDSILKDVHI